MFHKMYGVMSGEYVGSGEVGFEPQSGETGRSVHEPLNTKKLE